MREYILVKINLVSNTNMRVTMEVHHQFSYEQIQDVPTAHQSHSS